MPSSDHYGISDPSNFNLSTTSDPDVLRAVTCYILSTSNDYNGDLGERVSAIFVILVVSSAVTFFPVAAARVPKLKIPLYVYLFARYFGAGVIVATAFIHLLDPAYAEIGPQTCVGTTIGWRGYSWPPAIALSSAMITFLMEFIAERVVEKRYNLPHAENPTAEPTRSASVDAAMLRYEASRRGAPAQTQAHGHAHTHHSHQNLHSSDQDPTRSEVMALQNMTESKDVESTGAREVDSIDQEKDRLADIAFRQQITAFLVLEFGVLFHSVIIGLALGTAGAEFAALYPVLVFHQSFEGLGIGARLSAIPFPKELSWMPWALCAGYGLTTPVAIAAALGVRTTYNANSFTANVVSGVLDSISAGILMYTGFVELIARDFLFNPERTTDDRQLAFMLFSLFLGAGIMALIGKWA